MDSPLSAVMAFLYMETLEEDKLIRIMSRRCEWFRYMDNVLVIVLKNTNLENKLRMLNQVYEYILFTVEMEMGEKIPFFDTEIYRVDNEARFSVYRKPTNKDDFIHYLSRHGARMKSGMVIRFYVQALSICSDDFLEDELVWKAMYPLGLLQRLINKVVNILNKVQNEPKVKKNCFILSYARSVECQTI